MLCSKRLSSVKGVFSMCFIFCMLAHEHVENETHARSENQGWIISYLLLQFWRGDEQAQPLKRHVGGADLALDGELTIVQ